MIDEFVVSLDSLDLVRAPFQLVIPPCPVASRANGWQPPRLAALPFNSHYPANR